MYKSHGTGGGAPGPSGSVPHHLLSSRTPWSPTSCRPCWVSKGLGGRITEIIWPEACADFQLLGRLCSSPHTVGWGGRGAQSAFLKVTQAWGPIGGITAFSGLSGHICVMGIMGNDSSFQGGYQSQMPSM